MPKSVYSKCTHQGARQILKRCHCGSGVVTEAIYDPGLVFERHSHGQPNLGLVLRGTCLHEVIHAKEQQCVRGEIHYLPPGAVHSLKFFDKTYCIGLTISSTTLERLRDYAKFEFKAGKQIGEGFYNLGRRLVQEFRQEDDATPLTMECLIMEILVQMGRSRRRLDSSPSPALSRVRDLLHDGITEPVSLSDLARQVGMHPAHLAREFHKAFNCTMGEYLRNIRVQRALELLPVIDAPLSEISQLCGFYDQSHFSRCFKQIVGVSPMTYKKQTGS